MSEHHRKRQKLADGASISECLTCKDTWGFVVQQTSPAVNNIVFNYLHSSNTSIAELRELPQSELLCLAQVGACLQDKDLMELTLSAAAIHHRLPKEDAHGNMLMLLQILSIVAYTLDTQQEQFFARIIASRLTVEPGGIISLMTRTNVTVPYELAIKILEGTFSGVDFSGNAIYKGSAISNVVKFIDTRREHGGQMISIQEANNMLSRLDMLVRGATM